MNRRLGAAFLLLLFIGVILLVSRSGEGGSDAPELSRGAELPAPAPPLEATSPSRGTVSVRPRFRDLWSGEYVPAERVSLRRADGQAVTADREIPLEWLESSESVWVYEVPSPDGPVPFRAPLDATRANEPYEFVLPYSPRLRIEVREANRGAVVSGVEVRIAFLKSEDLMKALAAPEQDLETVPRTTYASLMGRYKAVSFGLNPMWANRKQREEAEAAMNWFTAMELPEERGVYELVTPQVGHYVFTVRKAGYAFDWGLGEAQPGGDEWLGAELVRRSVLRGTLFDATGRPLPRHSFHLYAIPDEDGPEIDWAGQDGGMGNMGIQSEDGVWHRVVYRVVRSDRDGGYRVELPPGKAYAVEARNGTTYAFLEVPSVALVPGNEVEMDIRLVAPEGGPTFRFVDQDGEPIPGMGVEWNVVDDIPWMRQLFPRQVTDERGEVQAPWFRVGETINPYLYPANARNGTFAPFDEGSPYRVIEEGKSLYVIHLPRTLPFWTAPLEGNSGQKLQR